MSMGNQIWPLVFSDGKPCIRGAEDSDCSQAHVQGFAHGK